MPNSFPKFGSPAVSQPERWSSSTEISSSLTSTVDLVEHYTYGVHQSQSSTEDSKYPESLHATSRFRIVSQKANIVEVEVHGNRFWISLDSLGALWIGQWIILCWGILLWGKTIIRRLRKIVSSNTIPFGLEPTGISIDEGRFWKLVGDSRGYAPKITEVRLESTLIGRLALAEQKEGWRGIVKYFWQAIQRYLCLSFRNTYLPIHDIEKCLSGSQMQATTFYEYDTKTPLSTTELSSLLDGGLFLPGCLPRVSDLYRNFFNGKEFALSEPKEKVRRVEKKPRFRRRKHYCCKCGRSRKYDVQFLCQCKHVRKNCGDCAQRQLQLK